jgi:hypothetical protein
MRGAAGIGKTALLEVTLSEARSHGYKVLVTAGVESEAHLPFAGLHQLVRPISSGIDGLPGPQKAGLLTAFGMLEGPAPALFLVGLAVLSLLTDAASEAPVLLIADDAHWLDAPTAAVLAFVGRRLEADPVVLLAAIRDGFPTPLLAAGLPEIELEPLDAATSARLLDAHAPDLAAASRSRVLREAAGNPLALVELPRALRSTPHGDSRALAGVLPLTDRLQRAFAARAAELPEMTRAALVVAAANDGIDLLEVLAATARVAGSAVATDIFEPAVAAALIGIDETSIRFRHPLVRSAVYQTAPLGQRQAVHRALAEVLANAPDRRAWHRAASIVGTNERAASDLEAAAGRAQQRGATAVAISAQERAAALTEDPLLRAGRLLVAAEMGFELGQPELVGRLLDAAERLELRPRDRARILWLRDIFSDGVPGDAGEVRRLVDCADETLRGVSVRRRGHPRQQRRSGASRNGWLPVAHRRRLAGGTDDQLPGRGSDDPRCAAAPARTRRRQDRDHLFGQCASARSTGDGLLGGEGGAFELLQVVVEGRWPTRRAGQRGEPRPGGHATLAG